MSASLQDKTNSKADFAMAIRVCLNPFRTEVPFWGHTIQILSSLSPKRDCSLKGLTPLGEHWNEPNGILFAARIGADWLWETN